MRAWWKIKDQVNYQPGTNEIDLCTNISPILHSQLLLLLSGFTIIYNSEPPIIHKKLGKETNFSLWIWKLLLERKSTYATHKWFTFTQTTPSEKSNSSFLIPIRGNSLGLIMNLDLYFYLCCNWICWCTPCSKGSWTRKD